MELRRRALQLLMLAGPSDKATQLREWARGDASVSVVDAQAQLFAPAGLPGRPDKPRRVPPNELAARSAFNAQGRAALLHAVAHIEFNAINLALDAVWRFEQMPRPYYLEWMQVAVEEALHFTLVAEHLATLGHAYGDFDAHDGLWSMAERTRAEPLARMALVPRTLEARGLDVTPAMREKFARAGDEQAARILDVILRDEIGHVAVGNRWYRWLCAREGRDPITTYDELATRYRAPRPKPPFNLEARRAAGFDSAELAALQAAARSRGGGQAR
jgi:uncharacterized ferritin-like protein (DUF455 family)